MIEEAMTVITHWLHRYALSGKAGKDMQESAQADADMNLYTGEGDGTLEEELSERPGAELLCVGRDAICAEPDDNESIFKLDERHLDAMSASHLMRGFLCVPGAAFLWLAGTGLVMFSHLFITELANGNRDVGLFLMSFLAIGGSAFFSWLFWRYFVSFDWFHYRANPIRFDRERCMVHVWRSSRVGGPFSVPWDDSLYLMRGQRDGDNGEGARIFPTTFLSVDPATRRIKRRFVVGKTITNQAKSDAFIAYIQRYMAEGPQAVPTPKRWAKMTPSLTYSFNAYFNITGALELQRKGTLGLGHLVFMTVLSPLLVLLSLAHFIAIVTGREPKWPGAMQ
ncbi:DUF6708 domain-containing protein [Aquabacterium parvum]|uniref:DUF6708 domain-containing protein n=1 Tax=Aquabacterium parvum TaxID=70584 RepID=UPI000718E540|nr:DUF6708 domain-containing protein [Aquabacterium parvum]